MAPAPTPLSSLKPRDVQASVCVYVARKWNFTGRNENGPILHVDLIFVDKEVWVPNISVYGCVFLSLRFLMHLLSSVNCLAEISFPPCSSLFLVQNYCREVLCTLRFQEMR